MCCFSIPGKLVANGEIPGRFATFKSETAKLVPDTPLTVQLLPFIYSNGYNISCYEGRDGSISINVSGGVPPYTFEWSTGESAYGLTTQTIYNLERNYYSVVVTDSESNSVIKGVTLSQPERHERIFATGTVYTYSNGYNVSCIGCYNGSINVEVSGGSGIYTYQWEDGATTKNRSGLGAGGYSLVIRDGSSCINDDYVILSFDLNQPPITNWGMQGNFGINPNTHFLGTTDNTDFVFRTDNIERLRLKSNGNIGIGTINPTEKLTVAGNGKFNDDLLVGKQLSIGGSLKIDSMAGVGFRLDTVSNKSYKFLIVDENGLLVRIPKDGSSSVCASSITTWFSNGNIIDQNETSNIGTCNKVPLHLMTAGIKRLTIDENGYVGVGTTDPKKFFHIYHYVPAPTMNLGIPNKSLSIGKPDTTLLIPVQSQFELDSLVVAEYSTGSLRIETVLGFANNSNSAWDIQPLAPIDNTFPASKLAFTDVKNNNNKTVMVLHSDGQENGVGIGVLTPRQRLHVHNGGILISGANSSLYFHQSWNANEPFGKYGNYAIEYIPANTINGDNSGGLNFWRPWGNVADGLTENFVMHLADDGNVGIGTGNPVAKLHVNLVAVEDWAYGIKLDVNRDTVKAFSVYNNFVNEDVFMIWGNGVVNTKTLYAEAVKVRATTTGIYWPDFVFDIDYNLMSLAELEQFIQLNKHLPDVPTQSQVEEQGIDVFEMNAILLKKIEELTLYVIDLQKQVDVLKK